MKKYFLTSVLFVISAAAVWACDSCGCEFCEPGSLFANAYGAGAPAPKSYFFANVVEQFTNFSTLRNIPAGVSANQYEYSSITQVILGYQISPDLNVQLNLPYIYRAYQNVNLSNTGLVRGQVNGLGDIRLVLNYVALREETPDWALSWRVSGGVKLPTGDSHLLDNEDPAAPLNDLTSGNNAVGGHDLALGSGSYDAIISTGITFDWQKFLFTADADFTIRGTGRDGYRYSNEFGWSAGPGYRVWQDENHVLTAQVLATGEYKAADTAQGGGTDDTFVSAVNVGPNVILAWKNGISARVQAEIPVMQHYDTGFQAIPAYRLKAALTFSF